MVLSSLLQAAPPRPYDLLVLGDPCTDLYFTSAQAPVLGEKRLGRFLGTFPGGCESNMACAASRLGLRVALFGAVGSDLHADELVGDLRAHGVVTHHLRKVSPATSACAMVLVAEDGEKAIVYSPFRAHQPTAGEESLPMDEGRFFFCLPYDIDRFIELSAAARRAGTGVAIDIEPAMAPDSRTYETLLRNADVVFLNADSFRRLNNTEPTADALRPLLSLGPQLIVVTLGADGALAATASSTARQPGFRRQAVDATGAGDCLAGAFLAALLKGDPLEASLRFGCAAASFAVGAMGARSSYPDLPAVQRMLQEP